MTDYALSGVRTDMKVLQLLTNQAMDAVEAARTAEVLLNGHYYAACRVTANLTQVAASDLSVTVYTSDDGGTSWQQIQSREISAGTGTASDYDDTGPADTLNLTFDISGTTGVRCVFAATSAGATDLLNAKLTLYGRV